MATPEGKVKSKVRKFLTTLGAWQYWPVSSGFGMHGVPDCLFCLNGVFGSIEVKAPGRRGQKDRGCSALQVMQMNAIREAKGISVVVDGEEDLAELKDLLEARGAL